MPFQLPSLPELIERTLADLGTHASSALRRSDEQVLARTHAGASHVMHGYLGWTAKQILPDRCDEPMLLRQARLRLAVPRKDAVAASGTVQATGAAGREIEAGTLLHTEDGRRYVVVQPTRVHDTTAVVPVRAFEAGAAGNLAAGATLSFVSPVLGVRDAVTVLAPGLTGGTDEEPIARLRQRVVRAYRLVPDGGNADDYVSWALEVSGITRAWCVRNYMGLGTVGVFVMRDDDPNPVPDKAACAAVQAHIEARRPVTAEVFVLGPVPKAIDVTIALTPDDDPTRGAVTAALQDLLVREGELGVTVLESHLREAISEAPGEFDHRLLEPKDNVVLQPNEIPVLGTVTWQ